MANQPGDGSAGSDGGFSPPPTALLGVGVVAVGAVGAAALLSGNTAVLGGAGALLGGSTALFGGATGGEDDPEPPVAVEATPPYPETIAMYTVTVRADEQLAGDVDELVVEFDGPEVDLPNIAAADVSGHVVGTDGTERPIDVSAVLPGTSRIMVTVGDDVHLDEDEELVVHIDGLPTPDAGEYPVDVDLNVQQDDATLPPATLHIVPLGEEESTEPADSFELS